jgi:hypothetical protein
MKEKIMNRFKTISMMFVAAISLTLAGCNTTPPMPENTQISSDTVAETKSTQKIYLRHYGPGGPLWHLIDFELYSQIIDYILAKGGLPTQENIDSVYDSMRH